MKADMEFKQGVGVFTAKGDKMGTIERVVVDPATKEVSHVIVQPGLWFTEDKVVPVDLIARATEERITLIEDAGDLNAMPRFEETRYVPAILAREQSAPNRPQPLYYVPPVGSRWSDLAGQIRRDEGRPRYVRRTERNIPEGAVALQEGTQVISADGKRVGDVEDVFVDEKDDSITHLLISRGFLFKEERFIPVSWIDGIWEDAVHLSVESPLLAELQPYLPRSRPDETDLETE
jgi:uncharacterized protein YrrD